MDFRYDTLAFYSEIYLAFSSFVASLQLYAFADSGFFRAFVLANPHALNNPQDGHNAID